MNLFESNSGADISLDDYWGSSSHNVFFRNSLTDLSSPPAPHKPVTSGLTAVGLQYGNRMITTAANVLGTPAMHTPRSRYECGQARYDYPCAFRLGYRCDTAERDDIVNATLHRHCNYDYVTDSAMPAPGFLLGCGELALTASLFRSAPPSFFCEGTTPWPVIGPDLSPMVGQLPALVRFRAIRAGRNYSCPGFKSR